MTFTTCGRSTERLACGALFARSGPFWSSILRQQGRDGTQLRNERRDSLLTGPTNRVMIWKMRSELMTIGMLGDSGRQPGTDFFDFVSLVRRLNSPLKKEASRASMTRYGTKSMSLLCSFLEVNRMYHQVDWKRGSKLRLSHLAQCSQSLHGTWLFHAEDEVRAGVFCRRTWEPILFHCLTHWSWTPGVCLLCLLGGLVLCLLCFVHDHFRVTVLSNRDNFILGTMTATIVMMSAAIVQKKQRNNSCTFHKHRHLSTLMNFRCHKHVNRSAIEFSPRLFFGLSWWPY